MGIERFPALHGDSYRKAIEACEWVPPFLVNDLLPEEAIFMLSSDGSVGKSTMSINAAAAMSAGLPVWGGFPCARPLRVYYVIGERTCREPLRRLKHLQAVVPANPDNLWLSDSFSGSCNLLMDADGDALIEQVQKDCPEGIDVLILDPLYPFVQGALSEDRVGNLLCRQLVRIKRRLKCVLWLCHHNVKLRTTDKGEFVRAANPMYGSVWLYNLVTIQLAAAKETEVQCVLDRKKDNWGVLAKTITLLYDRDTESVQVPEHQASLNKAERVDTFLREHASAGKPFTKEDLLTTCGIAESHFYRLIHTPPWLGRVRNSDPAKRTAVYMVK